MTRPKSVVPTDDSGGSVWMYFLAALTATVAVYVNSFSGVFVLDDVVHLQESQSFHQFPPSGWPFSAGTRPLWALSLAWDWMLWRDVVWGWHLTNLLLHLLAVTSLYFAVQWLMELRGTVNRMQTARVAGVTALLWGIHPLATGAVTYIVQRAEVGAAAFALLGFVCHLRFLKNRSLGSGLAACLSFWCALGMKEPALGAVASLPFWDRAIGFPRWRDVLRRQWFYYSVLLSPGIFAIPWVLPILFGGVDRSAGSGVDGLTAVEYWRTQPEVLLHYVRMIFVPWRLCFDPWWPIERNPFIILVTALPIIIFVIFALVRACRGRVSGVMATTGLLWLLPTTLVLLRDVAFEYRIYLPMALVIGGCVYASDRWISQSAPNRRRLWARTIGVTAIVFACLTIQRNQLFHDATDLWRDTLITAPHNPRAHYLLAEQLINRRGFEAEARQHAILAVEQGPDFIWSYVRASRILSRTGDHVRAVMFAEEALHREPELEASWYALADAREAEGDRREVDRVLGGALEVFPDNVGFLYRRGVNALRLRDWAAAVQYLSQGIERSPEHAELWNDLGIAYRESGNVVEAARAFREALVRRPDWSLPAENLEAL